MLRVTNDGTIKWRRDLIGPEESIVVADSAPIVSDGTVYFGTGAGYFGAVDLQTRETRWQETIGSGYICCWTATDENLLVAGANNGAIVAYTSEGEKQWEVNQRSIRSIQYHNGELYCLGRDLIVRSVTDGREKRRVTSDNGSPNAMSISDESVILTGETSDGGYLSRIENAATEEVCRIGVPENVQIPAELLSSRFYFGGVGGTLYSSNRDCNELRSRSLDGGISAPLETASGTIYAATVGGSVYKLGI
jgi:outer membrane protein assembly factor BamB